jgi:hypothetical protein
VTRFRAILGAAGVSVVVTASVLAFVTLSIPAVRDSPQLGLLVAVSVFVAVAAVIAFALLRRK